jgi:hypothetical protein
VRAISHGIGYPEEVQLSLGATKRGSKEQTVFLALDAMNDSDRAGQRAATHPVVAGGSWGQAGCRVPANTCHASKDLAKRLSSMYTRSP